MITIKADWICEFCYKPVCGNLPAEWTWIFQSAICPDCVRRAGDEGKAVTEVLGGAYASMPDPRGQGLAPTPSLATIHASGEPPRQCRFCGSKSGYTRVEYTAEALYYLVCNGCKARHPIDYSTPAPVPLPPSDAAPAAPAAFDLFIKILDAAGKLVQRAPFTPDHISKMRLEIETLATQGLEATQSLPAAPAAAGQVAPPPTWAISELDAALPTITHWIGCSFPDEGCRCSHKKEIEARDRLIQAVRSIQAFFRIATQAPTPDPVRVTWTLCTGCGWDSREPIGSTFVACCPDSRYRTPQEFAKDAIAGNKGRRDLMAGWLMKAISKVTGESP